MNIKFKAFYNDKIHNVLVIDWINSVVDLEFGLVEIPMEDVTLLQFTGQRDIDGEDIYEADVVEIKGHPAQRTKGNWAGINIDGSYVVERNPADGGFSIGSWKLEYVIKHCRVAEYTAYDCVHDQEDYQ